MEIVCIFKFPNQFTHGCACERITNKSFFVLVHAQSGLRTAFASIKTAYYIESSFEIQFKGFNSNYELYIYIKKPHVLINNNFSINIKINTYLQK